MKNKLMKESPETEQKKVRLFIKKNDCTFMICKGLTQLDATTLGLTIKRFLKSRNVPMNGTLITTRL